MLTLSWMINEVYKLPEDKRNEVIGDQNDFYVRFLRGLLKQLMEKIDKMREIAGITLQKSLKQTLHHLPDDFPEKEIM